MADFNSSTFATERYLSQLQSVSLESTPLPEPAPVTQNVLPTSYTPTISAPVVPAQTHAENNFSADYMQYRDRIQKEMGTTRRNPEPVIQPIVAQPYVSPSFVPPVENVLVAENVPVERVVVAPEPQISNIPTESTPEPSRDNPFSQLVSRKSDTESKDVKRNESARPFTSWIRKLDAFGILGLFFGLLLSLISLILATGISTHALLLGISFLLSGGVMFLTSGALRGWNALYAK